jgi:hypothetical protein
MDHIALTRFYRLDRNTQQPGCATLRSKGLDSPGILLEAFDLVEGHGAWMTNFEFKLCGAKLDRYDLEMEIEAKSMGVRQAPLNAMQGTIIASNQARTTQKTSITSRTRKSDQGLQPRLHALLLSADERGLIGDLLSEILECDGNITACCGQLLRDHGPMGGTAFACIRVDVVTPTLLAKYRLQAALNQFKMRWSVDNLEVFDLDLPGSNGLAVAA